MTQTESQVDQLINHFVKVLEETVSPNCDENTVMEHGIKEFMRIKGLSERVIEDISKWTLERYHTRLRESK